MTRRQGKINVLLLIELASLLLVDGVICDAPVTTTGLYSSFSSPETGEIPLYTTLWDQTYNNTVFNWINSIIETEHGDLVLAGHTLKDSTNYDVWLARTDRHGNMKWNQSYGGLDTEFVAVLIPTSGGGIVLAGNTRSQERGKLLLDARPWLMKTDPQGCLVWNRTYTVAGGYHTLVMDAIQTVDGGFALVGHTGTPETYQQNGFFIKTTSEGEIEWIHTYGGSQEDALHAVFETVDGFLLFGWTDSFGTPGPLLSYSSDAWVLKTDSRGNVEWTRTYGYESTDRVFDALQTADGGYLLVGSTGGSSSSNAFWTDWGALILKLHPSWEPDWAVIIPTSYHREATKAIQTTDGGFVVCGESVLKYYTSSWAVQLDALGRQQWDVNVYDPLITTVVQTKDEGIVFAEKSHYVHLIKRVLTESTPPLLSQPVDIVYEAGSAAPIIEWETGDRYPDFYRLYANSTLVASGPWTNGTLSYSLPPGFMGLYNLTLIVSDLSNNTALDLVWVTAQDSTPPVLSSPPDLTYAVGHPAPELSWEVHDLHPGTFTLYANSVRVDFGSWTNGSLTWTPQALPIGTHNITLLLQDAAGNSVTDSLWIHVLVTPQPSVFEFSPPAGLWIPLCSVFFLWTLRLRKRSLSRAP